MSRISLGWRRGLGLAVVLGATAAVCAGCTDDASGPCPPAISTAVIAHTDEFGVDAVAPAGQAPLLLDDLGDAPTPTCAFVGGSAASGDEAYAAVWVLEGTEESSVTRDEVVDAAMSSGIPVAVEDDDLVMLLAVDPDEGSEQVMIRERSAESDVIGLGATKDQTLIVLSARRTAPAQTGQ